MSESDKSSNIYSKSAPSISLGQVFIPLDVLVTAGKISFNLYDETDKSVGKTKFGNPKNRFLLKDVKRKKLSNFTGSV